MGAMNLQNRNGQRLYHYEKSQTGQNNGTEEHVQEQYTESSSTRTTEAGYSTNGNLSEQRTQTLQRVNPRAESRLNHLTSGLLVLLFGSWVNVELMKDRIYSAFWNVLFFYLVTAIAGLIVGIMLGEQVLPVRAVTIPMIIAASIVILAIELAFGALLFGLVSGSRKQTDSRGEQIIAQAQTSAYPNRRTIEQTRYERSVTNERNETSRNMQMR